MRGSLAELWLNFAEKIQQLAEFRMKLAEKTKVWRNSGPSCWKKPKVSGILSKIGENILVAEK
jgi:hypothetical protein